MSDQTSYRWVLIEALIDGERRLFVRAPQLASVGKGSSVSFYREMAPCYLTGRGWSETPAPFSEARFYGWNGDLLIEIPEWVEDETDEFDLIEVDLNDGKEKGAFIWSPEPLNPVLEELEDEPKEALDEIDIPPPVDTATLQSPAPGANADDDPSSPADVDYSGSDEESETSDPLEGDDEDDDENEGTRNKTIYLMAILIGIALAMLAIFLIWWSINQSNDKPVPGPERVEEETTTEDPPPGPGPESPTDILEQFKIAIDEGDFDTARRLLPILEAQRNPEAALIAAERAGTPGFEGGLFETPDNWLAYDYYRIACTEGGVGADAPLRAYLDELRASLDPIDPDFPQMEELTETVLPSLLERCG